MYDHIVRELLQAQIDSSIDTLLQDAKVTTLRKGLEDGKVEG